MPDRREALVHISNSLQQAAEALRALTQPGDTDIPAGMRHLLDAIDRVDTAASATGVVGSLSRIAEALGGSVNGAGSVSIGHRPAAGVITDRQSRA